VSIAAGGLSLSAILRVEAKVQGAKARLGLKGKLFLGALLFALLFVPSGSLSLSPTKVQAARHLFSLEAWELANFPSKWLHLPLALFPGSARERASRLEQVQGYFRLGQELQELEARIRRQAALRRVGGNGSSGKGPEEDGPPEAALSALEERWRSLLGRRDRMRPRVEEALEAEISTTLLQEEIAYRLAGFRVLFPPVDFRFDRAPRVLIASPRDRVLLKEAVLLRPRLGLRQIEELEARVEAAGELSALVEGLGGLGTYPSIIPDSYDLRTTLHLAVHEWLHGYFFFHPLGQGYRASPEMRTLNETAADMAGRGLGDLVFQRLGGALPPPASEERTEQTGFSFNKEMRATRQRVDQLLAQGRVREAEEYMEEQRQLFVRHGYFLRRLNQAYFAFYGTYAESAASVSPIAGELQELRARLPSLGAFVKTVARFGSYQAFQEHLRRTP
jgi:hypothetical protein